MRKYRLIKEYPGSPKLGHIETTGDSLNKSQYGDIECYPEFWEEVSNSEYEVIAYKYNESGLVVSKTFSGGKGLYGRLGFFVEESKIKDASIYAVKRLSDEEVFIVGNKVKAGAYDLCIQSFVIDPDKKLRVHCGFDKESTVSQYLENIRHSKHFFTTEDGVDKYLGDRFFYMHPNFPLEIKEDYVRDITYNDYIKKFSTREEAEEYILTNEPCLSIKDVINSSIFKNRSVKISTDDLKKKVKSKIYENKI